jgi:tryptophan synthase alpha subunit
VPDYFRALSAHQNYYEVTNIVHTIRSSSLSIVYLLFENYVMHQGSSYTITYASSLNMNLNKEMEK